MDTEIDEAIMELLKLKNWNYSGIDVRIRDGKSNIYTVNDKEENFPENTSDDDISRLKEKLELLKRIDEMLAKLRKYDTDYVPYYPWTPWPGVPISPFWCDTQPSTDTVKINWQITGTDG